MPESSELAALPAQGRVFTSHRRVRANDADTQRRLRLDGMARYLQDVAFDDLNDAGFSQVHAFWVLRRCIIRVIRPAHFNDEIRLRSWCSALSGRWCNKRVTIDAGSGALVETEGFWINVDGSTGIPAPLSEEFIARFSVPAADHKLHWRRMLPRPPVGDDPLQGTPFPMRAADFDWLSHVNNAAYWYVLEDYLEDEHRDLLDGEYEAVLEYNAPITAASGSRYSPPSVKPRCTCGSSSKDRCAPLRESAPYPRTKGSDDHHHLAPASRCARAEPTRAPQRTECRAVHRDPHRTR